MAGEPSLTLSVLTIKGVAPPGRTCTWTEDSEKEEEQERKENEKNENVELQPLMCGFPQGVWHVVPGWVCHRGVAGPWHRGEARVYRESDFRRVTLDMHWE